jgi:hypothetical protein
LSEGVTGAQPAASASSAIAPQPATGPPRRKLRARAGPGSGDSLIAVKPDRAGLPRLAESVTAKESVLDAWRELFSTDIGLMSLGVLVVVIGIGLFFVRWFQNRIREDTAARDAAAAAPTARAPR